MVPVGYMAKCIFKKPHWLLAPQVVDIFSVSGHVSKDFADYVNYWKHNGYWFFDSPEVIRTIAQDNSIDMSGTSLFYYEAHEKEFDGERWHEYTPEPSFPTKVISPSSRRLEGFDVVTFSCRTMAECSPLSCNYMANELATNAHCLIASFEEAEKQITNGLFNNSEPGPYRVFAVYSVDWPS
jgi:hypothetical protein